MTDTFEYQIDDTFVNYDTRSLLSGKELSPYTKRILFEVFRYYNNKNITGNTDTKRKIIDFLHKAFEEPGMNYDKLMKKFNAKSNECLLAYFLIAYKNERLDLILRCMYSFGRVLPLKTASEWFDNYRLNNYGNPLNLVMWQKYDCNDVYTVSQKEPLPINKSVQLPFAKVVKFLVGSLRAFIIDHNLYPNMMNVQSNGATVTSSAMNSITDSPSINDDFINGDLTSINGDSASSINGGDIETFASGGTATSFRDNKSDFNSRNLNAEQICDECYLHYPFYYGGAHGCDVFDLDMTLTLEEIKQFLDRYPSAHVGYILNTATYRSGKGEHWVALELTKGKAKLICSQQSDFTVFKDGGKLNSTLKQLMFGQEYNPVRVQVDDFNCGIYSALSLYELLCNNSDISKAVAAIGVNGENIKPGYDIQDFRRKIAGTR